MKKRIVITILSLLSFLALPIQQANAAFAPVAVWNLNESSAVHQDSSGHGITATSGNEVQNGIVYSGATGIRMKSMADRTTGVHPGRLTRANNSALNANNSDYAVTVRYRNSNNYGNLIQKGQNATAGGYFKIELPNGDVTCLFKDGAGVQRAVTAVGTYNTGQWMTVRCERLSTGINLYINGVKKASSTAKTGTIANTIDLTIGGKGSCNQQSVSCDYFVGDIDSVSIEKQ